MSVSFYGEPNKCYGAVHAVGSPGAGLLRMSPAIPNTSQGFCLILGMLVRQRDIVQPVVTLNDKRSLMVYGSAWNETAVVGVLLLGARQSGAKQYDALAQWYKQNRVSKKMGPVTLSIGSRTISAYVFDLALQQPDSTTNSQGFTISCYTQDV